MHSRLKQANFSYLLIGLLAVLFISPLTLDLFDYSSLLLSSLTFSATMIIGVWSLRQSKRLFRFGLILIGISLCASALESTFPELPLEILRLLVVIVFCTMSFVFILADITSDLKVDANRVIGAICLYLLLGFVFGLTYIILETLLPGSFSNISDQPAEISNGLFYYSYVTLTTMGYGDIVPLRPLARTFAYLEAIIGVFYMAIMIGSMIGLLLNRANRRIVEEMSLDQKDK
jgi:hypothetical protein